MANIRKAADEYAGFAKVNIKNSGDYAVVSVDSKSGLLIEKITDEFKNYALSLSIDNIMFK